MPFSFIHLSDPQFGMFQTRGRAPADGTFPETALYEKAVEAANRLRPAFVVVTGDLVQDPRSKEQHEELMRITNHLIEDVPIYLAPGNCDVGNTPTRASLQRYRDKFGDDNYSFDACGSHFVVLNSSVCADPSDVQEEWESIVEFLRRDLERSSESAAHTIVFMHHPLFAEDADEPDTPGPEVRVIPRERRMVILDILRRHNVSGVFSGHWHRNAYASDGRMLMVISGPVGFPLGDDPSGIRIVNVYDDRIEHQYYGMYDLPDSVEM